MIGMRSKSKLPSTFMTAFYCIKCLTGQSTFQQTALLLLKEAESPAEISQHMNWDHVHFGWDIILIHQVSTI
jgi:hypothetical protein